MSKRSFYQEGKNLLADDQVGGFYEEAIRMLQDAYFRISAIDLENNSIVKMKFMKSEDMEVEQFNADYRMTILSCAGNHVAEDERESFNKMMSAEKLKQIFLDGCPSLHFSYLRLLGVAR